jgi:hypothetical protein
VQYCLQRACRFYLSLSLDRCRLAHWLPTITLTHTCRTLSSLTPTRSPNLTATLAGKQRSF